MISGIFGLPASGKSIFSAYVAHLAVLHKPIPVKGHFDSYYKVYTNFPCSGCYKLNFDDLGNRLFSDCLIIIDEIQLFADSRNYKNFSSELSNFLSLHRKFHVDIIYCSQSYDTMDKRIRSLTDTLYYIDRWLFGLIRIRPIKAYFRVLGTIQEGYEMGSNKDALFYIPSRLYGYVDTDALLKNMPSVLPDSDYWDSLISYDFPVYAQPYSKKTVTL